MSHWPEPKFIDSWYESTVLSKQYGSAYYICPIDPIDSNKYACCDLKINCDPTVQWEFKIDTGFLYGIIVLARGSGSKMIHKSAFPIEKHLFYIETNGPAIIDYNNTIYNCNMPDFTLIINKYELSFEEFSVRRPDILYKVKNVNICTNGWVGDSQF